MGHLLKIKCVDSRMAGHILASTSVPFTVTTVQANLALTNTKRITVKYLRYYDREHAETQKISVSLL